MSYPLPDRHTQHRVTVAPIAASAPAATAAAAVVSPGPRGADADLGRQRRRPAQAGEAEAPEDRVLQRTADAPGGVVHGQPVPESGQTHRTGAHSALVRKTDQDMVPEQAHEGEEVQKRFR